MANAFIISQLYVATRALAITIRDYVSDEAGGPSPAGTRLGFTPEWLSAFSVLFTQFDANYKLYINREERTTAIVAAMKTLNKQLTDMIRAMQRRVKNTYELIDADYNALGVHKNKETRTPSTIPEIAPLPVGVSWDPRRAVVEGSGQSTESFNRFGLPNKQKTWLVSRWGFAPQGTAPETVALVQFKTIGRSRLTIELEADKAGMVLFIQMAYRTNAGRGPWSRIVQINVV